MSPVNVLTASYFHDDVAVAKGLDLTEVQCTKLEDACAESSAVEPRAMQGGIGTIFELRIAILIPLSKNRGRSIREIKVRSIVRYKIFNLETSVE